MICVFPIPRPLSVYYDAPPPRIDVVVVVVVPRRKIGDSVVAAAAAAEVGALGVRLGASEDEDEEAQLLRPASPLRIRKSNRILREELRSYYGKL